MKEYTFNLNLRDGQVIITALKKMPMEMVEETVTKMIKQAEEQDKVAPTPPTYTDAVIPANTNTPPSA